MHISHHTSATPVTSAIPARIAPILPSSKSEPSLKDADALALSALGWLLTDQDRAERLLSLTGLTPEILRDGLTDPAVLAAVMEFLANHEPDLVKAADALEVPPETLIAAHRKLSA